MFETIDEVIEFLSRIIENKNGKIYSNGKDSIILEINLMIGVKNEIIKINLHKRNINLEETVFQLIKKIEEMQKEINNLKLTVYGDKPKKKMNMILDTLLKMKMKKNF